MGGVELVEVVGVEWVAADGGRRGWWGVLSQRCASLAHTKPISSVGSGSARWRPLPLRPGVRFPSATIALRSLVDLRDGRSPFVCTARYGPPLLRHSPSLLPTPLSSGERGGCLPAAHHHIISTPHPPKLRIGRSQSHRPKLILPRLHRRSCIPPSQSPQPHNPLGRWLRALATDANERNAERGGANALNPDIYFLGPIRDRRLPIPSPPVRNYRAKPSGRRGVPSFQ
jgi:hypothetical protein